MARINISQILFKRGNTSASMSYTGPVGEVVIDTDLDAFRIQDGLTPGGRLMATTGDFANITANLGNLTSSITTLTGIDANFVSNINALLSNAAVQSLAIGNLQAFQTYANATFGTSSYGNANVALYLSTSSIIGNINANITAANAAIISLTSNAATQATLINAINANVTAANAAIVTANTALKSYTDTAISTAINNLINSAPGTLDTLAEIDAALGNNASFSDTMISWFGNISANLTTANTNISNLDANIGAFETATDTAVTNINANVTAANTAIATLQSAGYITSGALTPYATLSQLGANATAANAAISSITANLGAFETYANTTFTVSSYGNSNVAAYLAANPQGSTYSNANVAAYLVTGTDTTVNAIKANVTAANAAISAVQANVGAYYFWNNANATTLATSISTVQSAATAYQSWANANVASLSGQIATTNSAIATANSAVVGYVNSQISTLSSGSSSSVSAANAAIVTANAAVVSFVNSQLNNLITTANANTAAYLTTATGNVKAGNVTIVNQGTVGGNLYVLGNLQVAGTTTTINQTNLTVSSVLITVANSATNASQANGAGISAAGANANITYSAIGDQWNSNKPISATALYDAGNRVMTSFASTGAGNVTVTVSNPGSTTVALTPTGPGAITTGSATAIPVITTDAYGRIASISTAAVSSTLTTVGTTGTGSVSLTSQSLNIGGTNGLTATASGQTITLTDTLWPAANANLGTATTNISALQSATGAYYAWANANLAGQTTNINAVQANTGAYYAFANANLAGQTTNINTINANIGSYYNWNNANATTLATSISNLQANTGSYYAWANANVSGLSTSITASNAAIVTANTAMKSYVDAVTTAWTANAGAQAVQITNIVTTANTNTAAYLAAGISTNVTTTGNISAGNVIATNIIVNGQQTNYGVVTPAYMVVGQSTDISSVGNGSTFILNTVVGNVNSQTSYNSSTGVFTLTAGVTYDMSCSPSWISFSNPTGGYLCYQWVDATTNSPLDSTGTGTGTAIPTTDTTGQQDNATARVIYTPTTNQTVKLRVTAGAGTATLRGGLGTQAVIKPLNPTIVVAANPVGFRATTPVTNVSVNNGSTVTMLFGTEEVDTNSVYDPATGRFTPNAAGYYSIDWFIVTNANGAGELIASLYKNGVLVAWGTNQTTATAHWNGIGGSAGMIYLNGTTDYISIALTYNSGSTATILAASSLSYFSAYLIR